VLSATAFVLIERPAIAAGRRFIKLLSPVMTSKTHQRETVDHSPMAKSTYVRAGANVGAPRHSGINLFRKRKG
jgi:hypothetical protein